MTTYTISQAIVAFERIEWEKRCLRAAEEGNPEPPKVRASEEEHVKLYAGGCGALPPITRLEKESLATLRKCTRLALSSNAIDRISPGLSGIPDLTVLSLSRNKIRKLENLDLPKLRQLWLSYNFIEKLSGLERLRELTTLYLGNNCIESWGEIEKLEANPNLSDILLVNNRVHTDIDKGSEETRHEYRQQLLLRLPGLAKIDGEPVAPEEREHADSRRTAGMV
ncbi:Dynein light chain 1 [Diplonema papillatum]|nr:Dynein light chain 1 [Diplonema papillatum]